MAPMFGQPNYSFIDSSEETSSVESEPSEDGYNNEVTLSEMAFYYTVFLIAVLLIWLLLFFVFRLCGLRQKTRDPQPRRVYVGSRPRRSSFGQEAPTIYVSPANLPPPPKYEAMAPPSYEEVVGVHYPQYQPPISSSIQPITQPITTAVAAHNSRANASVTASESVTTSNNVTGTVSTVVTVTSDDRRTSVTVANSG